jgi:serpin B
MNKNSFLISLILIIASAVSCKNGENAEIPDPLIRELSVNEAEIATSANNFTFDLITEIEGESPNENYFISSFSISTALSMVMNGASQANQEGFIQTLGLSGMSPADVNESYKSLLAYIYGLDPSIILNVANSNWYSNQYVINSDFADILMTYYDAEVFVSDFASSSSLDALNGWVENETNGKIKNILDSINPDDVMFLINAIYFKARWTNPFDPTSTEDLPFQLVDGNSVDVPTMVGKVKHWWSYDNTLNAQVIEIPYGNENYAFTIIMPDDESQINNLVSEIDVNHLQTVLADSVTLVRDLYLPKFQLDFKTDLKDALVNMGMPLTELDNLFEEKLPLEINKVIHQSFLEVNEEGSEAAAATIVGVDTSSVPASTHVDQPFVFLIRERNSGTILFSGKLLDPS